MQWVMRMQGAMWINWIQQLSLACYISWVVKSMRHDKLVACQLSDVFQFNVVYQFIGACYFDMVCQFS